MEVKEVIITDKPTFICPLCEDVEIPTEGGECPACGASWKVGEAVTASVHWTEEGEIRVDGTPFSRDVLRSLEWELEMDGMDEPESFTLSVAPVYLIGEPR